MIAFKWDFQLILCLLIAVVIRCCTVAFCSMPIQTAVFVICFFIRVNISVIFVAPVFNIDSGIYSFYAGDICGLWHCMRAELLSLLFAQYFSVWNRCCVWHGHWCFIGFRAWISSDTIYMYVYMYVCILSTSLSRTRGHFMKVHEIS